VDTLAIQRSLTILEDRYRELREIGQKHRQAWEVEESSIRESLADFRGEKEGLEGELIDAREESELLLLQLHQVQEELEHYFLQSRDLLEECRRKDEKLNWLRGQRESLLRMLSQQGRLQQRFITLDARTALPSILRRVIPWWRCFSPS
jgi:chromosome segregation ATPase